VAAFAPARSITVEQAAAALGLSRYQARMFRRFHGMDRLHDEPHLSLVDLVAAAGRQILDAVGDRNRIRYVIYADTVIEVTPAHLDAVAAITRRLDLDHAESFAITQQNCASGLAAVDVAGHLLRADADPSARALVLTGEKPFTPLVRLIANTTIMGEASAACLVALDGPDNRVRSYAATTIGKYSDGVRLPAHLLHEFRERTDDDPFDRHHSRPGGQRGAQGQGRLPGTVGERDQHRAARWSHHEIGQTMNRLLVHPVEVVEEHRQPGWPGICERTGHRVEEPASGTHHRHAARPRQRGQVGEQPALADARFSGDLHDPCRPRTELIEHRGQTPAFLLPSHQRFDALRVGLVTVHRDRVRRCAHPTLPRPVPHRDVTPQPVAWAVADRSGTERRPDADQFVAAGTPDSHQVSGQGPGLVRPRSATSGEPRPHNRSISVTGAPHS